MNIGSYADLIVRSFQNENRSTSIYGSPSLNPYLISIYAKITRLEYVISTFANGYLFPDSIVTRKKIRHCRAKPSTVTSYVHVCKNCTSTFWYRSYAVVHKSILRLFHLVDNEAYRETNREELRCPTFTIADLYLQPLLVP